MLSCCLVVGESGAEDSAVTPSGRVEKRLRKGKIPTEPVAECIHRLRHGQTDLPGLRMKRLKGIGVPVFEARVNRDIRLVFTVQGSAEYDGQGTGSYIRDRVVVWDVDHHDDALNRARGIDYEALHALEPCSVACLLNEQGVLEEMEVSAIPEYPFVPISVVQQAVNSGKGVLRQYLHQHYRGEQWWLERATEAERESLYDAQEFLQVDADALEAELRRIASSSADFLLHLLPEQMEFVRQEGLLLLSGTVGSGKTTILLYNLYWHARLSGERYLLVSYSPQLTSLCALLFRSLPDRESLMPHVDIRSFEQILRNYFLDSAIVSYAERRRQFHERYTEAVKRWQMDAVPKALKRFRREHPQLP